jgi:HAD superfamily hydrolase (TIGR01549 family)
MTADGAQMSTDNHEIKAIFFDFGGVILEGFDGVDHDRIEAEFGLEASSLRRWVYRDSRWNDYQIGKCTFEEWTDSIRQAMAPNMGDRTEDLLKRFQEAERLVNHDMVGLIKRLHGRYTLGIISNTVPGMMERLRRLLDFVDLFDIIVGSGDVGIAKPDAGIYLHATELAGVAPKQSVFTDDRADLAEAAREVGMHGFHFTGYERFVEDLRSVGVRT